MIEIVERFLKIRFCSYFDSVSIVVERNGVEIKRNDFFLGEVPFETNGDDPLFGLLMTRSAAWKSSPIFPFISGPRVRKDSSRSAVSVYFHLLAIQRQQTFQHPEVGREVKSGVIIETMIFEVTSVFTSIGGSSS